MLLQPERSQAICHGEKAWKGAGSSLLEQKPVGMVK
jgi:hypothetical protein